MHAICEDIRRHVLKEIDLTKECSDEELQDIISKIASDFYKRYDISIIERVKIEEKVFNSLRGFDILQELIDDPSITEIMVNGPNHIFYEKEGIIERFDQCFANENKLQDVIQNICFRYNRSVNLSSPIVDTRLPDGSRVNIVLGGISLGGSVLSIRKFPANPFRMEELIEKNTISAEAAELLHSLVKQRYSIFISGGTSSGKTTFLNALSNFIPSNERIITIEDSAELQIQGIDNLIRLETRNANTEYTKEITVRDLTKTALRMRPDRIIVAEIRGPEAIDMLSAMNTGHDGSLSTGHANSTRDILSRIETMTLMGMDIPLAAIRQQICSGIDVIVQMRRMADKSRKVVEIAEIDGIRNGEIQVHPLYQWKDNQLVKVGELKNKKDYL